MQDRKHTKKKESGDLFYKFIAVAIPLFLVLTIGFYFVQKSGVIERNTAAASVGNVKISVPEYAYFYKNIYNTYSQQFSMYGVDTSKPLTEQMYSETESWDEFLKNETLKQAQNTIALAEGAKKAGIQLTKEEWDEVNSKLKDLDLSAKDQNSSTDSLLQSMYGRFASRGLIRSIYERDTLAAKYYNQEQERINSSVTAEEIESAYSADKSKYDAVDYRYFFFNGTPEATKDAEGKDVEPTDIEKVAAKTAAKSAADALLAKVTNEASFASAVKDSLPEEKKADFKDESTLAEKAGLSSLETELGTWLFDDARKAGDKAVIETSSGCYVALFNSRYRDEEMTVTVRHMLFSVEKASDTDADAEAKNAESDRKAKEKADEIFAQWQQNPTEENFAQLAEKNSSDSSSAVNGGLIERIPRNMTVEEFDAWCFDASRKSGDAAIVKTSYGYHIIYYVKQDVPAWQVPVISDISGKNLTKFMDDLAALYPLGKNDKGIAKALDSYNLVQQA